MLYQHLQHRICKIFARMLIIERIERDKYLAIFSISVYKVSRDTQEYEIIETYSCICDNEYFDIRLQILQYIIFVILNSFFDQSLELSAIRKLRNVVAKELNELFECEIFYSSKE
jgi:hypothetical protein